MKIIGLTGGMGVGKSTVAKLFEEQGYPIYNSDRRAKELMTENTELKEKIISILGKEAYNGDILNREYIAKKIFSDKKLLRKQNTFVHKAVRTDFLQWLSEQNGDLCIKEAAILFESGSYKDCDYTIVVTAPYSVRISRILSRDSLTKEDINKRLQNQWPQEKLVEMANFQIINDSDLENLRIQVNKIINRLQENI